MANLGSLGGGGNTLVGNPYPVLLQDYNRNPVVPTITPTVIPTTSPQTIGLNLDSLASVTYGKPIPVFRGGKARIGGIPFLGPYIDGNNVTFGVAFAVPANVTGTRKVFEISLDSKVAWTSTSGGTVGGDGTFNSESFTFRAYGGTLTQTADDVEVDRFGAGAIAYRGLMYVVFEDLSMAAFDNKAPYVACMWGDVTDGADPDDGVNLGTALEDLAYSPYGPGLTSSTFDTDGIEDVVGALLLDSNIAFMQLLQNLTSFYTNLDIIQTDKIHLVDYGDTTDADVVISPDWVTSAPTFARSDPSSVPRDLEFSTIDPDADYLLVPSRAVQPRYPLAVSASVGKQSTQLPIVLGAPARIAQTYFAQSDGEAGRKQVSFTTTFRGYELEEGKKVSLESFDGFDDDLYKITEIVHGADFTCQVTARSMMQCGVTASAEPASGEWDPNFIDSDLTLSNGNATVTSSTGGGGVVATTPILEDSYWEVEVDTRASGNIILGVAWQSTRLDLIANDATATALYSSNGLGSSPLNVSYGTGDRIGVAFRPSTGDLWFRKNGTWLGNSPSGSAAKTAAKAGGRCFFPAAGFTATGSTVTLIVDPNDFDSVAPSGFAALQTGSLPDFKWNSADIGSNLALSDNDTKVTKSSTGAANVRLGIEAVSGKQVWAVKLTADGAGSTAKGVGLMDKDDSLGFLLGSAGNFSIGYQTSGAVKQNTSTIQTYTAWGSVNDVIMIATDNDNRKIWFGLNGSWNGDPAAGTGAVGVWVNDGSSQKYGFIACGMTDADDAFQLVDFPYSVPSGFTAPGVG